MPAADRQPARSTGLRGKKLTPGRKLWDLLRERRAYTAEKALSYVWGGRDDMQYLYIGPQQVSITKNLHAALQRLRYRDRRRTLWVDAICINQDDLSEKSTQVAMMSEVYGLTSNCLIWLGEEPEAPVRTVSQEQSDVDKLLKQSDQFLQNLTSSLLPMLDDSSPLIEEPQKLSEPLPATNFKEDTFRITRTRPCTWYGDARDAETLEMRNLPSMRDDSIFQAFCAFRLLSQDRHLHEIAYFELEPDGGHTFLTNARRAAHWLASRDWWTRVWTVQECILPKGCMVIYGPVEMPWDTLLTAVSNFQRHRTGCCASIPGIHDMLNFHVDIMPVLEDLRTRRRLGEAISLETLVREFRYRAATDPRDKIYALLPLVTDWGEQGPLAPDYSNAVSPVQVYSTAVLKMIECSGSLSPLCQQIGPIPESPSMLPSWAPDLSSSYSLGGTLDHFLKQIPLYDASLGMVANARILDSTILVLEAVRIDSVKRASTQPMSLRHDAQISVFEYWHEVAEEECKQTNPNWRECFWRTLCGDTLLEGSRQSTQKSEDNCRRATAGDEAVFEAWCVSNGHSKLRERHNQGKSTVDETRALSTIKPEEIGGMNQAIKATTTERRFIVSKSGKMGIAPKMAVLTMPTPDEIFVIPGSKTPFVLRPLSTREVPGVGERVCYALLGDCYLHGVMDGEAMGELEVLKETIFVV
ncbi:hypothetical protein ACJZ2D_001114 [Fusarium nematophilum]